MAAKLTDKQRTFVAEYLVDLNATQAAIRAGYSARNADKIGPELLGKTRVAAVIAEEQTKRAERTELTQDRVLEELKRIAFGDLRDAVVWGPSGIELVDSAALTDAQAAAISEIGETVTKEGGSTRIKRHDKVKALELIMRHMGMLNDKLKLSGELDLAVAIEEGRKRVSSERS